MYDVIIIGGGPGGYAAAIRASQLGGKVAVVEARDVGGTCVNRGCIPTKIWLRAAYLMNRIKEASDFGIKANIEDIDLTTIVARKDGVGGDIKMGMEALLKNNRVELINASGMLKSAREVIVGDNTLETKKIIIATGSTPEIPDIKGLKDALLTTNEALELKEIPSSTIILGGGPIEVEFAACLNSFGSKVTLITNDRRILPLEDQETSQRLTQALKEQGVDLINSSDIDTVEKSKGGFAAKLTGSGIDSLEAEKILVGSRKPSTAGLGLEGIGVSLGNGSEIKVNEHLQTSVEGVYAIGDATGGWMLSHAASAMGVTAAENSMGQDEIFPSHLVPRGLWTFPQVGAVGLSEDEAEEQGYEVEVGSFPYSINGLAMARGEVLGSVKIVTDEKYGEVLGVHIVGAGATELIGEAVMAMQLEATADDIAHTIRMHPTYSETLMDAGRDAGGWALYLPRK